MVSPILDLPNWVKTNGPLTSNQIGWLHSAECPLRGGYARSLTLASNNDPDYIASWFGFIGPEVRVHQVPGHLTAWTQGYGNPFGPGWEQEGYAAFTREQWLTPLGLLQLENLAQDMAEWARKNGVPARWLTTDEVQAVCFGGNRTIKGFAIHAQIANDRTDPGVNYPYDILINRIAQINGGPRTTGPRPPAHIEDNPKEDTLSAAEVKQINAHVSAEAQKTREYIGALMVAGYTVGGQQFPGSTKVDIETQRRVTALTALVTELLKRPDLTAAEITAAVESGLANGAVTVDINVKGAPNVV